MIYSFFLFALVASITSLPAFASIPDTLAVVDVSRDTVDQTPAGWERIYRRGRGCTHLEAVHGTGSGIRVGNRFSAAGDGCHCIG
jgi:hypothetical protein